MNLMKASAVAVGLAVILAALAGPANSDGTYSCYDSAGCSSNACIDGGKQCHNDFDCQGTCGSCKQCWAWGCGFLGIYWDCGKNCAKCGGSCSSTSNYCSSRSGCYTTCQCSSSSCGSNQYLSGCGGSSSGTCTTCGSCPPGQERQGCYGLNSGSCNSCPSIPSGAWFTGSGCSYEACPSGESNCGSPTRDGKACANLQTNQWHCGACNRACPSGQICTQGSCACPSGTSMCGSTCLDLQSDKKNCGTCGTPCSAGKICSSGTCVCESGLTDCSGNCVDLKASFSHCGGCGTACPVNQTCLGGSCGCPNSQTYCGDNCFDTLTETKHCGACSKACPATQICSSGTCVCPIGLAYCADSGLCSDHKTDTGNCGACSKRCGRGQTCENATCICPSGLSYCASVDSCIDLQSDTQNCGSCGSVCPAEATRCSAGQCRLATFSAEPAGAPMVSDNTTALGLMQGSNFGISTARGGLACTPKCAINAAAKSEYVVGRVSNLTAVYTLRRGTVCLLVQEAPGLPAALIEAGCPRSASAGKRQDGNLLPFWHVYNSSGSIRLLNANMDDETGCILVPSSGNVGLGACANETATTWNFSLTLESGTSTVPIGVIVGAAVGGAVAVAGAAGAVYYGVRRNRAKKDASTGSEDRNSDCSRDDMIGESSVKKAPHTLPVPTVFAAVPETVPGPNSATPNNPDYEVVPAFPAGSVLYRTWGGDSEGSILSVPVKHYSTVDYAYAATAPDELALKPGDRIYVDKAFSDGWALGSLADGKQGLFPGDFLVFAQAPSQPQVPPRMTCSMPKSEPATLYEQKPAPSKTMSGSSSSTAIESKMSKIAANDFGPFASKLLVDSSEIIIDRNQRLGEGGFGVVYAGILRGSNAVAVKTIKGDLDEKTMLAFIKEVVNWEGLVQRNVLPLMAFCISPPMMITDLVEEGNMRKYLAGHNWDQAMGLRFLIEVTAGMSYLHGSGILHGDLKSLNVLIDGSRAVITDFGLSQLRSQVSKSTSKVGNGLQGTPGFVAPEILAGGRLQAPADVYAFAMTAYEVLSRGSYPFEDLTNVATIVYKVAVEQARPARPDGVADPVWTLVERCWAHDPAARPTFVEAHDQLVKIIAQL